MKKQRWFYRYVFHSNGITAYLMLTLCLVFMLSGCGSDSNDYVATPQDAELTADYADRAVLDWVGIDYSNDSFCDGLIDSDYDGPVDANDAVMLIRTWQRLGLEVPATPINGLYENRYCSDFGFDHDLYEYVDEHVGEPGVPDFEPFSYTVAHPLGQEDIKAANTAQDWDLLTTDAEHPLLKGDLIFLDYDKDSTWDNAVLYLGHYGEIEHAVLLMYDYYDEGVVLDAENNAMFRADIAYGYSDVRRPDYAGINEYGATLDMTPATAWFCDESPSAGVYTLTITFSAGMTGFTQEDIIVGNGSISDFATEHVLAAGTEYEITQDSTCVYTMTIMPSAAGDITVSIPAGSATGSNGEANAEASYSFSQEG